MNKKIYKFKSEIGNKSFTTKEANDFGISTRMLTFYVQSGDIERVGRGIYTFSDYDVEEDYAFHELVLVSKSIKGSVICLISALDYWGITDEIQREYWLAIPNNYPIPKIEKKIRFIRPRNLEIGVIEKEIAGEVIKITTPERSICDAFKHLDEETAISSLREYMNSENVNIDILLTIASELKTTKVIQVIQELTEASGKAYPKMNRRELKASLNWLSKNRRSE